MSPLSTYQTLGIPFRVVFHAINGMSRKELLKSVLQEANGKFRFKLSMHNTSRIVEGKEIGAFEELSKSRRSIVISNHVGATDFIVNMQVMDYVNRLDDLRWVTLKIFENKISKPVLTKMDALLLSQKPGPDKVAVKEYADEHQDPNMTFAISIAPEGGILDKKLYKKCKRVMEKYIHYTFENMCTPHVGALEQLINLFPNADIFDVTIKYFDKYGSGHTPSNLTNVFIRNTSRFNEYLNCGLMLQSSSRSSSVATISIGTSRFP